jgi:hypothetical protein
MIAEHKFIERPNLPSDEACTDMQGVGLCRDIVLGASPVKLKSENTSQNADSRTANSLKDKLAPVEQGLQ